MGNLRNGPQIIDPSENIAHLGDGNQLDTVCQGLFKVIWIKQSVAGTVKIADTDIGTLCYLLSGGNHVAEMLSNTHEDLIAGINQRIPDITIIYFYT